MKQYSKSKKRGCPVCEGVDPKSCMRCRGNTFLYEWFVTDTGAAHITELSLEEFREAEMVIKERLAKR